MTHLWESLKLLLLVTTRSLECISYERQWSDGWSYRERPYHQRCCKCHRGHPPKMADKWCTYSYISTTRVSQTVWTGCTCWAALIYKVCCSQHSYTCIIPTHPLTHSLTHSLTLLTYSLTCPPTHSLTHPLNLDSHSPTHSLIPLFYHTANLCQDVEEDIATIPVTRDSREHVRRCVVLQWWCYLVAVNDFKCTYYVINYCLKAVYHIIHYYSCRHKHNCDLEGDSGTFAWAHYPLACFFILTVAC